MRHACLLALAALLALPSASLAQDASPAPALRVSPFVAYGEGPSDTRALGLQAERPLTPTLALRVEGSRWTHGLGSCTSALPNECDGGGWAALAGLAATAPGERRVRFFAALQGGLYAFDGIATVQGGETAARGAKPALGVDAGVRVRLVHGWAARLGARHFRAFGDDDYTRAVGGESLNYRMAVLGLEYGLSR